MADNENTVMFREAFAGYSKKDVNKYLSQLSEEFARRETEEGEKYSRLGRELAEEKRKNAELSEKLDELACEAYSSSRKACSETVITDKLRNENHELSEKLDELACELYTSVQNENSGTVAANKLRNENHELSEKLDELACELYAAEISGNNQTFSEKSDSGSRLINDELFEKIGDRINEIISAANVTAEEIIVSANDRSDEIIAEATRAAEKIREDASEQARKTNLKTKEMYKEAADEYYDEVAQFADEIQQSVSGLLRDIAARSAELGSRIDYMRLECENTARIGIVTAETGAPGKKPQEIKAVKPQTPEQKKKSAGAILLDEKIEEFFRNTMAGLNALRNKNHDKT